MIDDDNIFVSEYNHSGMSYYSGRQSGYIMNITVNNQYTVIEYNLYNEYKITNDNNELVWCDKKYFITLDEYRLIKIDKLL